MASPANRRAIANRFRLIGSREQIIQQEVDDALAATPAERMEALIALLDAALSCWQQEDSFVVTGCADLLESLNSGGVAYAVLTRIKRNST